MDDKRKVFCEDAITWLESFTPGPSHSMVASLPDISEFPAFSLSEWKSWFIDTAVLVLSKCSPLGVTIFYQSDIKYGGEWVDKGFLCQKAAEKLGHKLLWHKIVCRSRPGIATFGRPSYSHILCFSQEHKVDVSKSTPDVLEHIGEKTWQRGMGLEATLMIARFISEQTSTKTLINPFCGEGSMLAAANAYDLNAIGVEKSSKRAGKARSLQVDLINKSFIPSSL